MEDERKGYCQGIEERCHIPAHCPAHAQLQGGAHQPPRHAIAKLPAKAGKVIMHRVHTPCSNAHATEPAPVSQAVPSSARHVVAPLCLYCHHATGGAGLGPLPSQHCCRGALLLSVQPQEIAAGAPQVRLRVVPAEGGPAGPAGDLAGTLPAHAHAAHGATGGHWAAHSARLLQGKNALVLFQQLWRGLEGGNNVRGVNAGAASAPASKEKVT